MYGNSEIEWVQTGYHTKKDMTTFEQHSVATFIWRNDKTAVKFFLSYDLTWHSDIWFEERKQILFKVN